MGADFSVDRQSLFGLEADYRRLGHWTEIPIHNQIGAKLIVCLTRSGTTAVLVSQRRPSVPIVALAPLLVIWFGSGLISKVFICALIVFFPVLINTIVGLRAVPRNLVDLMLSLRATPGQFLRITAAELNGQGMF